MRLKSAFGKTKDRVTQKESFELLERDSITGGGLAPLWNWGDRCKENSKKRVFWILKKIQPLYFIRNRRIVAPAVVSSQI